MSKLIDSYDSYNEFERTSYFTVCFESLPSKLLLEVPMEKRKENIESVLELINSASLKFETVFKNWSTEDSKDSDSSKDFAHEYLLKCTSKKLILWVSLEKEELTVDFLYAIADTELEKWVISTNEVLRRAFGENKSPVFKVLSRNRNDFFTEEVKTDAFEIDISKLYNDDFIEINEIILSSLEKKKSGLILLHGIPGTGKTSYIKSLITRFEKNNFIFIQNEFINELLSPEFVSFLLKRRNAILIIEDAEKVITSREYSNENSVVSTILQLTDGLFSDYLNIKIICTFNTSLDKIDKALLRKGRMIASYEFKQLSRSKADQLMRSMGHDIDNEERILADIFNYSEKGFEKNDNSKKIGF